MKSADVQDHLADGEHLAAGRVVHGEVQPRAEKVLVRLTRQPTASSQSVANQNPAADAIAWLRALDVKRTYSQSTGSVKMQDAMACTYLRIDHRVDKGPISRVLGVFAWGEGVCGKLPRQLDLVFNAAVLQTPQHNSKSPTTSNQYHKTTNQFPQEKVIMKKVSHLVEVPVEAVPAKSCSRVNSWVCMRT